MNIFMVKKSKKRIPPLLEMLGLEEEEPEKENDINKELVSVLVKGLEDLGKKIDSLPHYAHIGGGS